ncbi:MAG: SGNH/GDSL hydrolase family protein [Endozoicomonas sp.]|uniref:SGNH/GDSL hydrolase family protein n=1 Tax=Endozoicomonas sp. TaxID=1892382 RepID=UPI003D9B59EF
MRFLAVLALVASSTAYAAPHNVTKTRKPPSIQQTETTPVTVDSLARFSMFGDSLSDIGNTWELTRALEGEIPPDILFKVLNADIEDSELGKILKKLGITVDDLKHLENTMAQKLLEELNKVVHIPVYPNDYYFQGRFSNGPVWNEWLIAMTDVQFTSPDHFVNRAYGGSFASDPKDDMHLEGQLIPPDMKLIVNAYLKEYPAEKGKLWMQGNQGFSVLYGGNDYIYDFYNYQVVVERIIEQITRLADYASQSATQDSPNWIFVGNLPDLAWVPRYKTGTDKNKGPLLSKTVQGHNKLLSEQVLSLQQKYSSKQVRIELLDVYSLVEKELQSDHYKIKDQPCYDIVYKMGQRLKRSDENVVPCPKETWDDYAFWDPIHPSRKLHANIAYQVCQSTFSKVGARCFMPAYDKPETYPNTAHNP